MMPGIGFAEMILLVLVAIVVVGPKDLPLMMRKFGRFTGKMRALAFEFKQGIDELGRQAELDELRKEVAELKKHTGLEDLQRDFEQDQINMQKDIDSAMEPAALPPASPDPATPAIANGAAPDAASATPHPGEERPEAMDRSSGSIQGTNARSAESKGAELPPVPVHAGLSPDHPGYDTGEEFTVDTPSPEPAPAAAPQPVKQDTPA